MGFTSILANHRNGGRAASIGAESTFGNSSMHPSGLLSTMSGGGNGAAGREMPGWVRGHWRRAVQVSLSEAVAAATANACPWGMSLTTTAAEEITSPLPPQPARCRLLSFSVDASLASQISAWRAVQLKRVSDRWCRAQHNRYVASMAIQRTANNSSGGRGSTTARTGGRADGGRESFHGGCTPLAARSHRLSRGQRSSSQERGRASAGLGFTGSGAGAEAGDAEALSASSRPILLSCAPEAADAQAESTDVQPEDLSLSAGSHAAGERTPSPPAAAAAADVDVDAPLSPTAAETTNGSECVSRFGATDALEGSESTLPGSCSPWSDGGRHSPAWGGKVTAKAAPPTSSGEPGPTAAATKGKGSLSSHARRLPPQSTEALGPPQTFNGVPFAPTSAANGGLGGRNCYPLDMRNLYIAASLAAEETTSVLIPRLHRIREAYRSEWASVRSAAAALSTVGEGGEEGQSFSAGPAAPSLSLVTSLDAWNLLQPLYELETEFSAALHEVHLHERTIQHFNLNVDAFNAHQDREQQLWGPVYRSSLAIAYLLCSYLKKNGLEEMPEHYLALMHPVALFVGCPGGHRELRLKLKEVLIDVAERAKKVQVHVEVLPDKLLDDAAAAVAAGKLAHEKAQSAAAGKAAGGRGSERRAEGPATRPPCQASDIVSCLTTEQDVLGVRLTPVDLPSTRIFDIAPLSEGLLPSKKLSGFA